MPILNDTVVKGDLDVSGEIIENGVPIQQIFCTSMELIGNVIVLKNIYGDIIGTGIVLPGMEV